MRTGGMENRTSAMHSGAPEPGYILMDPSGNVTLLVLDPVPESEQPAVAAELMKKEPLAEQAGFLSFPGGAAQAAGAQTPGAQAPGCGGKYDILLRMAGGEFCGNASMSAAVYFGMQTGMTEGRVTVKVSGTPDPVRVTVKAAEKKWQGTVEMPHPCSIETVRFPDGQTLPVVSFDGISHVIFDSAAQAGSDTSAPAGAGMPAVHSAEAESLVKTWCRFLGADALGLLFWNSKACTLEPLVYVPAADTLFWESACGSGSAAIGAWLAQQEDRTVSAVLKQPGGTMEITASPGGPLLLKGTVKLLSPHTSAGL